MIDIRIEYDASEVTGLKKAQLNQAFTRAHYKLGQMWREILLPIRFTREGITRYGLLPRVGDTGSGRRFRGSYTAYKVKKHGHKDPLRFSSEGRDEAIRTERIKATRYGVTISLPRKFNRNNPKSKINMTDEVRSVTQGELRRMSAWLVELVEAEIAAAGGSGAATFTLSRAA